MVPVRTPAPVPEGAQDLLARALTHEAHSEDGHEEEPAKAREPRAAGHPQGKLRPPPAAQHFFACAAPCLARASIHI